MEQLRNSQAPAKQLHQATRTMEKEQHESIEQEPTVLDHKKEDIAASLVSVSSQRQIYKERGS
jgi:hypothetical protein